MIFAAVPPRCSLCGHLLNEGEHGIEEDGQIVCHVPMVVRYPAWSVKFDSLGNSGTRNPGSNGVRPPVQEQEETGE